MNNPIITLEDMEQLTRILKNSDKTLFQEQGAIFEKWLKAKQEELATKAPETQQPNVVEVAASMVSSSGQAA